MAEQAQWEYRVQTVGSVLATKDEQIEATLNEWGEEGWEAFGAFTSSGTGKVTLIAKRPLPRSTRRLRTMPGQ